MVLTGSISRCRCLILNSILRRKFEYSGMRHYVDWQICTDVSDILYHHIQDPSGPRNLKKVEYLGVKLLGNVCNCLPVETGFHFKTAELLSRPLWEFRFLFTSYNATDWSISFLVRPCLTLRPGYSWKNTWAHFCCHKTRGFTAMKMYIMWHRKL